MFLNVRVHQQLSFEVKSSFYSNDSTRIYKASMELRYACKFWASHVQKAETTKELLEILDAFVTSKLLFWLEVESMCYNHTVHAEESLNKMDVHCMVG